MQHLASARKGQKDPLPNALSKYGEKAFSIALVRSDACPECVAFRLSQKMNCRLSIIC